MFILTQALAIGILPEQSGWSFEKELDHFIVQITTYIASVNAALCGYLLDDSKEALSKTLLDPVVALLEDVKPDLWTDLNSIMGEALETQAKVLEQRLAEFGLSKEKIQELDDVLRKHGSHMVKEKVLGAAEQVGSLMKQRFDAEFLRDSSTGLQRRWTPSVSQHCLE